MKANMSHITERNSILFQLLLSTPYIEKLMIRQ